MKKALILLILIIFSSNLGLAQETKSKEKNKQKFGLFFDNLSASQKAFNAETSGVVINRVSKGLPGEAAGVLVGDILTHIDTIAIKDLEHCVSVMQAIDLAQSAKTTLKIIRNGVKMDLKLTFE